MADIIAGVFPIRDQAEAALRELRDRGFSASRVGIATRQIQTQARAAGGAQTAISEPFGWVPDHRVLSSSGQFDVLVAGLIADCQRRDGGNQNTVAGLLGCLGVNLEHACWYDQQVSESKTLIAVMTDRPAREVESIMYQYGSVSVPSRDRTPSYQREPASSESAGATIPNAANQLSSTTVPSGTRESTPAVTNAELQSVEPGWEIVGANGQKIGRVDEIGPDYLLTKKGFIFTQDIFIPFSAVGVVLPNQVKLNVPASQVGEQHWNRPPMARAPQTTSTNIATTMPMPGKQTANPSIASPSSAPIGQPDLNRVKPGFDVYTSDGKKIGTIQEASAECLHVFQCSNLFVPAKRVERVDTDRITLNVALDQMGSVDWSTCHPTHQATYAPGGPGYSGVPPQEHADGATNPIEKLGDDQSNQP